jgi:LmbE family N-acetylglucosaminyl deacetylase/SAM-dependent methyltransferase
VVTFSHTDQGTEEKDWAASGLAALQELPLAPQELSGMRFVVLAAHPDDESLGAGGLLALLHSVGADVEVLLCTAGEGSHPDSATTTPEQLKAVRMEEFAAAMEVLGLAGRWHFLGLPDAGLNERIPEIRAELRAAINRPGNPRQLAIVAPYHADGHADHDAVGTAAADVAREGGHALLEYPIWYWLWASPEDPSWQSWARLSLDIEQQAAKRDAMGAHASQVRPLSELAGDEVLLGEGFLAHFHRSFETFAWTRPGAPDSAAAGSAPVSVPHTSADAQRIFDGVHAKSEDPWQYTTSWYERRKRLLTLAALPREKYESGLEIGCSIGTLTAELAGRCASLLAVDASSTALELAAQRLAPFAGVSTRQLTLPAEWPAGRYDLIVVSEVGYYLAPSEFEQLLERIRSSMAPGGTLLLCHWRHPVSGWELDGDSVHALARDRLRWRTAGLYQERDFVLETLVAPGGPGSLEA